MHAYLRVCISVLIPSMIYGPYECVYVCGHRHTFWAPFAAHILAQFKRTFTHTKAVHALINYRSTVCPERARAHSRRNPPCIVWCIVCSLRTVNIV